jgi:short-subunit dehydrogenase involved in D-alanine esterification of teichoic acids
MSARIQTILILGATKGIGEALTRRFHKLGKKVIATGRTKENLDQLARELPGLETRVVSFINLKISQASL